MTRCKNYSMSANIKHKRAPHIYTRTPPHTRKLKILKVKERYHSICVSSVASQNLKKILAFCVHPPCPDLKVPGKTISGAHTKS